MSDFLESARVLCSWLCSQGRCHSTFGPCSTTALQEMIRTIRDLCCGKSLAESSGLIILRGQCVAGHLVRASFLARIRHRNTLTEKAWEDAVQELGKEKPWGRSWPLKRVCLKPGIPKPHAKRQITLSLMIRVGQGFWVYSIFMLKIGYKV